MSCRSRRRHPLSWMPIRSASPGKRIALGCMVAFLTTVLPVGSIRLYAEPPIPGGREVRVWVDSLRTEGLALSREEFQRLHEDSFCVVDRAGSPAGRYEDVLGAVDRKQDDLQSRYRTDSELKNPDEIVSLAQCYIEAIVYEILFPLWVGIEWDFSGVPGKVPRPGQPVACGHLLQKLLTDAGFTVQKRAGTWLAYLAPEDFIQSIQGSGPEDYRNWSRTAEYLEERGPGLYFFGIEAEWGHVLMGRYLESGKLWLLHSGPHPRGANVNIDDGERYLTEFQGWQHIWVARLDGALAVKWPLCGYGLEDPGTRLGARFMKLSELKKRLTDLESNLNTIPVIDLCVFDTPDPLVGILVQKLGVPAQDFIPVRVVSHHMRLLGVLVEREDKSDLILVGYDDTMGG